MPDHRCRRRRSGPRRLAVGLALLALPLVALGAIQVTSILEDALWETGKRHAADDAELVASDGLGGVRSGSALRSQDITEVAVWSASGRVLYADPSGSRGSAPAVVREALTAGRTAITGGPTGEPPPSVPSAARKRLNFISAYHRRSKRRRRKMAAAFMTIMKARRTRMAAAVRSWKARSEAFSQI